VYLSELLVDNQRLIIDLSWIDQILNQNPIHMKKFFYLLLLSMVFIFPLNFRTMGQAPDTSMLEPVYENQRLNENYSDLQKYFLEQEKTFKDYRGPVYLYSISYDSNMFPDPAPRYFRLGYDYLFGLNAHNISIGVNPLKYREDGFNFFVSGRVGFGAIESSFIYKNLTDKAKINSMFGLEAEVESPGFIRPISNLKFFGGLGFSYIKPEDFTDAAGNKETNVGTALDPFLGARYYFAPKNSMVKFGFQAKVGFIYSNGLKRLDDDAASIYYGIGANIVSGQSFTKKGNVGWMNFESGLFLATASGVLYGQFTQPVRLMQNLSIGLNGHIGTGLYESIYNGQRVNTYWGAGLDLRFFGYDRGQIIKPYFGLMFQDYGYQFQNGNDFKHKEKILSFFRIGSKVQFGRKSNWCVDVNAGVPMAAKDTFLVYTDGTNTRALDQPVVFEVNVGLVYKIRLFEEKSTDYYLGQIEIYDADSVAKLEEAKFDPLPQDLYADQLIEKKIYLEGKPQIREYGMPEIDVTDIKLLRFIYDSRSGIDRMSPNFFYDVKGQAHDTLVLLIAMFDKERCDVETVGNNNMYLVFNDLNKSRYFGFTYDYNKRLQPEMRSLESLKTEGDDPYYGSYQEFIRRLHWLDDDVLPLTMNSLDGKEIEGDILRYFDLFNENLKAECEAMKIKPYTVSRENFRFAYAIYPQETFARIKEACKNYGVSIMFRFDRDKSNKPEDEVFGFTESLDGSLIVDPNDAAFFSNLIHGSEIYSPCTGNDLVIDDFVLGKDYLTESHKEILAQVKAYDCDIAEVSGYTDKVEFTKSAGFMNELFAMRKDGIVQECISLGEELEIILAEWQGALDKNPEAIPGDDLCQRGLAWKRIRSALAELDEFGFGINEVKTAPVGINPETRRSKEDPSSRKVVIGFRN
jgi:hypothetical protein